MNFRTCQLNALRACELHDKGIVRMCCGSGKTLVEINLCLEEQVSCLVAPRNSLLKQHVDTFKSVVGFTSNGEIEGDDLNFETDTFRLVTLNCESDFQQVQFTTPKKTCYIVNNMSLQNLPVCPDILVVDEAHTYKNQVKTFVEGLGDIKRKYFFTATPQDMDDVEFYGDVISTFDYMTALQYGYVAPFKIVPIWVDKDIPSFLKSDMKKRGLSHCIHFYETVNGSASGNISMKQVKMKDYGKKTFKITEKTQKQEREQIISNFKQKGGHLLSCKTISYGIDIVECDAVYLSYVSNSVPDTVQKIMRGIRVNPQKPNKVAHVYILMNVHEPDEGDITKIVIEERQRLVCMLAMMLEQGLDLDVLGDYPYIKRVLQQVEQQREDMMEYKESLEERLGATETEENFEMRNNLQERLDGVNKCLVEEQKVVETLQEEMSEENKQNATKTNGVIDFFDDYDLQVWYENGEIQSLMKEMNRKPLSLDEAYNELLAIKKTGKKVNNQSKEKLSNGTQVGSWLTNNRKKLTEEQLRALQLHDFSLEEAYNELFAMKQAGKQVNNQSKERLSNGTMVGCWLNNNRKKLSEEQLRALELHDLSLDEAYNELLAMKQAGKQVNTQSKERFSNGTQVGSWLARNKGKLSEEKLRALELYDKTLSLEEAYNELLAMKQEGQQVNGKSKDKLSDGRMVRSWLGNYRKKLSEDQLRALDTAVLENKDTTNFEIDDVSGSETLTDEESFETDSGVSQSREESITQKTTKPKHKNRLDETQLRESLTQLSREELEEFYRKHKFQTNSGYRSPNPISKDKINALLSASVSKTQIKKGKVIVLDDIDFRSSKAVYNAHKEKALKQLVVPNNSNKSDEMNNDKRFGKCVVKISLQEYLDHMIQTEVPICAIYADLMGQEFEVLQQIAKCNLTKDCIVGFTVSARSNEKATFTNSFATKLVDLNYKTFNNPKNLVVDEGGVFVYGENMRMATSVFRVNCK